MTAYSAPFGGQRPLRLRLLYGALFAGLVLFAGLYLLLVGASGAFVAAMIPAVAAAIAVVTLSRPTGTALAMLLLVPLSRFVSMMVYTITGSAAALRGSQIVKDELLIFLVLGMANLAVMRAKPPKIMYLDLLVVSYLLMIVLYAFYMGPDGKHTDVFTKVLAMRQDGLYFLAYFVGRGIPLTRSTLQRILRILVGLSVVLGLVAVFQFVLPGVSNGIFYYLNFQDFMRVLGTGHEELAVRTRGIGGADLPRSSSLFLSDLGLAYYQLLVIPLAAALFFYARGTRDNLRYGVLALGMLAVLAMTITRSALLAGVIGFAVVALRVPAYPKIASMALAGLAVVFAGAIVMGFSPATAGALFSAKEDSAVAHIGLLDKSVTSLKEEPLGLGLGNGSHVTNLVGSSGGLQVGSVESWYFQLGLEMGVVAMVLFAVMLTAASVGALLASFRVRDELLRVLTVTVAGSGISLMVIGVIQPVWAAVHVAYLFWFLAGIAARAPELDREWAAAARAEDTGPPA